MLLAGGLLLQWTRTGPAWLASACFVLATLAGGLLVFPAAWQALRKWRLDMNVLMTVAVTGAWFVGEGAEGASVVFLFALSELPESWSVGRARRAIASLLKLSPDTALVRGGDGLWLAILADTGATLLVILNALRLLRAPRSLLL